MERELLKDLFQKEKEALTHFLETFELSSLEAALKALKECEGTLVFTGVGKSGLVAKKIAVTMTSTGSRALFLSPTNALHGDIGILNSKDIFVILSKSGESEEALNLIPFIRNRGVKIISMVCNPNSRLGKASDIVIHLPPEKELCPYDMAPTTSTTIQGIVGDILTIALMQLKEFSLADYAQSHPAGRIGKRMIVKVKDLMLRGEDIPLCGPDDKLVETLVELSNRRCGCVLVVNESHKLLGIFTDGDLRRALQSKGEAALQFTVRELMTKNPHSIESEELAWSALKRMEADQKHPVMVLPVLEGDKVIGLIKMHDIVQAGI